MHHWFNMHTLTTTSTEKWIIVPHFVCAKFRFLFFKNWEMFRTFFYIPQNLSFLIFLTETKALNIRFIFHSNNKIFFSFFFENRRLKFFSEWVFCVFIRVLVWLWRLWNKKEEKKGRGVEQTKICLIVVFERRKKSGVRGEEERKRERQREIGREKKRVLVELN